MRDFENVITYQSAVTASFAAPPDIRADNFRSTSSVFAMCTPGWARNWAKISFVFTEADLLVWFLLRIKIAIALVRVRATSTAGENMNAVCATASIAIVRVVWKRRGEEAGEGGVDGNREKKRL